LSRFSLIIGGGLSLKEISISFGTTIVSIMAVKTFKNRSILITFDLWDY